jgi:hypothetical protein
VSPIALWILLVAAAPAAGEADSAAASAPSAPTPESSPHSASPGSPGSFPLGLSIRALSYAAAYSPPRAPDAPGALRPGARPLRTGEDGGLLYTTFTAPPPPPSPFRGLLRPQAYELSRTESTFKGASAGMTAAMFVGALSETYDWWDDGKNAWLVGGAAALGALYGGSLGHGSDSWRIETRLAPED